MSTDAKLRSDARLPANAGRACSVPDEQWNKAVDMDRLAAMTKSNHTMAENFMRLGESGE